jgi:hypothetical protein
VALLAEMRDAQTELGTRIGARAGKLAAAASPPAPATNAAAFAKRLGNDVHLEGQRIIHRPIGKPYKKRMRMPSMLDPHLADIERWLVAEPRLTALAILIMDEVVALAIPGFDCSNSTAEVTEQNPRQDAG